MPLSAMSETLTVNKGPGLAHHSISTLILTAEQATCRVSGVSQSSRGAYSAGFWGQRSRQNQVIADCC